MKPGLRNFSHCMNAAPLDNLMRFLLAIFISFVLSFTAKTSFAQVSVPSAQVSTVANIAEADRLLQSWSNSTKIGLKSMISQETGVTSEIQAGVSKLSQSCRILEKLKPPEIKAEQSKLASFTKSVDSLSESRQNNRADLLDRIKRLNEAAKQGSAANCGFLGLMPKDPLACQVDTYKKEMSELLAESVNSFYNSINTRYGLYRQAIKEAQSSCVQPGFIDKLLKADTDYLVPYEDRSYTAFKNLIESINSAYLNQAITK